MEKDDGKSFRKEILTVLIIGIILALPIAWYFFRLMNPTEEELKAYLDQGHVDIPTTALQAVGGDMPPIRILSGNEISTSPEELAKKIMLETMTEMGMIQETGLPQQYIDPPCDSEQTILVTSENMSDLELIRECVDLLNLKLSGINSFTDLTPLVNMTELRVLEIPNGEVVDITPLSELTNLRKLDLSNNKITSIGPLTTNEGIDKGDEINLQGNPLSEITINELIPKLLARGVIVTWE